MNRRTETQTDSVIIVCIPFRLKKRFLEKRNSATILSQLQNMYKLKTWSKFAQVLYFTVKQHYKGADQTTLMRLLVCVAVVLIQNRGGKKV